MIRRTVTVLTAMLGMAILSNAQEMPARDTAVRKPVSADSLAVAPAPADSLAAAPAPVKPEFWKGWFGEVDAMAGATAVFPKESTLLKDNRGFLFNGNALVSAWSDRDQFTFVAGGKNTDESTSEEDTGTESYEQGLVTAAQTGVNYFTTRLKGIETSASANYKFTNTETGTSSELNEFGEEEFMSSKASTSGNTLVHNVTANAELKKEKGKVWFHVKPLFRYVGTHAGKNGDTRTMSGQIEIVEDEEWRQWQEEQERWRKEEEEHWRQEMEHWQKESGMSQEEWQRWYQEEMAHMNDRQDEYERRTRYGWAYFANNASSNSTDDTGVFTTELNADMTVREIGGKKDRNLKFGVTAGYDATSGRIDEHSTLWTSDGSYESRDMYYDVAGGATRLGGSVGYVEQLAPDWTLSATADVKWTRSTNARNASDAGGPNERFSSVSNANNLNQKYDVTAQYKLGANGWVSFGGNLTGVLNETYSKSKGIEETTGEDDWYWYFTPTAKLQYAVGSDRFTASVSGNTQRPGTTQMLPVLDLRVLSRPGIGNIYLKPYSSSTGNVSWTRSDKQRSSSLSVSLSGSLNFNPIIYARWYDSDKVQYSLPVNSRKPGFTTTLSASYSTPLDDAKLWTLAASGSARYNTSVSYQATSALPAIDKNSFDYAAFMETFWGDASGDVFYGGGSGFAESVTRMFQPSANVNVQFKPKHFIVTVGASSTGRISRYSLNPKINVNTMDTRLYASGVAKIPGGFEAMSSFAYVFYLGYTDGFGLPEYQWNAELSKKFGDFVVSFKAFDILNQTRSLTHSVTANYEEDTYRLTMGRYFLLGVKWGFGKSDAAHGQRARQAFKALAL